MRGAFFRLFFLGGAFYMLGQRGRTDTRLLASETTLTRPFLIPGAEPVSPAELRRTNVTRTLSWVLVAALHVAFFFLFVLAFVPFQERMSPIVETILMLPSPGNNAPPLHTVNPVLPNRAPRAILSAPLTLPKPPPVAPRDQTNQPVAPGDVLGAVGRELACSAGSWEHLTQTERERCGGQPWQAMRLPNGNLVMVPPSQLPRLREAPNEFVVTGRDRALQGLRTGQTPGMGGCPIMQSTPCLHPAENGLNLMGGN